MKHAFRPLQRNETMFLSSLTGIDFTSTDFRSERWLCVTGYEGGKLAGLCVFEFKTPFEAYFSLAIANPRCITRRVMRAMFTAAFTRAVRITAEIDPDNAAAIEQAGRLGFVVEGYKRLALDGRRDALLLGMTADTCRYLHRAPRGSQRPLSAIDEARHGQHP